jgi:hypothetical protein
MSIPARYRSPIVYALWRALRDRSGSRLVRLGPCGAVLVAGDPRRPFSGPPVWVSLGPLFVVVAEFRLARRHAILPAWLADIDDRAARAAGHVCYEDSTSCLQQDIFASLEVLP